MRNKIELKATLVGANFEPLGFVIEEHNTMGMVSQRGVTKEEIIAMKLHNSQVMVRNGQLFEIGNFKINSLPMFQWVNGQSQEITNDIEVIGRFVDKNKNVGYRVAIMNGSKTADLPIVRIVQLSYFFKPKNFCIKTNANGNTFLYGKQGTKIEELPIVGSSQQTSKKTRPNTIKKEGVKSVVQTGFDIIGLMDALADVNGQIIRFPGDKYNATGVKLSADSAGFMDVGVGEIASARLDFNATKLNVNAAFKKIGIVNVPYSGQFYPVNTFQYRTKHLFSAGQKHMDTIGVVIPEDRVDEIIAKVGDIRLTPIEESAATKRFNSVLGEFSDKSKFFSVDMQNIDLISKERMKNALMPVEQIADLCKQQYELKLILKMLRPGYGYWTKEAKKRLGNTNISNREIYKAFSMFGSDFLKACEMSGIDVYTGAYTNGVETKKVDNNASADNTVIEIEYGLMDHNYDKISGKQVLEAVTNNDSSIMDTNTLGSLKSVLDKNNTEGLESAYMLALQIADTAEKKLKLINRMFWEHNATMYILGSKLTVHNQDKENWESVAKKSRGKAEKFICKSIPNLVVSLSGVSMAQ